MQLCVRFDVQWTVHLMYIYTMLCEEAISDFNIQNTFSAFSFIRLWWWRCLNFIVHSKHYNNTHNKNKQLTYYIPTNVIDKWWFKLWMIFFFLSFFFKEKRILYHRWFLVWIAIIHFVGRSCLNRTEKNDKLCSIMERFFSWNPSWRNEHSHDYSAYSQTHTNTRTQFA